MDNEKVEIGTEQDKKAPYDKPTLAKHGDLKDLTAGGTPGAAGALGCSRLFV